MSRIRSRMRSMLMRPSVRAKGPPGQEWAPRPKARCSLEFGRALEAPGVAVGRSIQQHDRRPRCDVDTTDARRPSGEPEVGLHRALDSQRLFDEVGYALPVRPKLVLELRRLGEVLQPGGE